MSRPAYPKYKPSGIEWLGDVPDKWDVARLRFYLYANPTKSEIRDIPEGTPVSFVPMEAVGELGGMQTGETKIIEDVLNGYTYFRDGDVVVAKITPCFENGKGAIAADLVNGIGFGTTELHVLRPCANMERSYLFYLTMSHGFRNIGASYMYGAGGQKRVPDDFIRNLRHPIPSLDEQGAIAVFLDRETGRIDALIGKKARQIELLREKRAALISHVVTKGLDPNAPMKGSGIEWLGQIPAHWDIRRLKRIAQLRSGESITSSDIHDNGEFPVYGGNGLRGYTSRFTHEGEYPLIGRQGALCGCINYASGSFWASEHAVVVSIRGGNKTKWLGELLRAMNLNQYSQSAAQPGIAVENIAALFLPIPPINEQRAIAAFLDRETGRIDAIVEKVRTSIDKLREYRTALISAAVTGKIDVRGEAS